jgi:hypothetical protein
VQCAILSVGRFDDSFIMTEEPEPGDRLVRALEQAVKQHSAHSSGGPLPRDKELHSHMPFELRALEVSLDEALKLLAVEVRGVVLSAENRMYVLDNDRVRHPLSMQ